MKRLITGTAIISSLALIGCTGEPDSLKAPAFVIAPGYMQLDSGVPVQVLGFDSCPESGYRIVGRLDQAASRNCTVVEEGSMHFDLSVGTSRGIVVERWRVLQLPKAIRIERPNGDGVIIMRSGS